MLNLQIGKLFLVNRLEYPALIVIILPFEIESQFINHTIIVDCIRFPKGLN